MADQHYIYASYRDNFNRFLNYRGIKHVNKRVFQPAGEENTHYDSDDDENRGEEIIRQESRRREFYDLFDIESLEMIFNDSRILDFFGLSRVGGNSDADIFYEESGSRSSSEGMESDASTHSTDSGLNDDQDFYFVALKRFGDRRYNNNTEEDFSFERDEDKHRLEELQASSKDAFTNREIHDILTKLEIANQYDLRCNFDKYVNIRNSRWLPRVFTNDHFVDLYGYRKAGDDILYDSSRPCFKGDEGFEDICTNCGSESEESLTTYVDDASSIDFDNSEDNIDTSNSAREDSGDTNRWNREDRLGVYESESSIPFRDLSNQSIDRMASNSFQSGKEFFHPSQGTGGVYGNIDSPDFKEIDYSNPLRLLSTAPASRFRDLIQMRPCGLKKVSGIDNIKFKNNLSVVIGDEILRHYLVIASHSELVFYEFDGYHNLPKEDTFYRFDTKPDFTSANDRIASTLSEFPHTINFLKASKFLNKQVMGACMDDGSLMLWQVESLCGQIDELCKSGNGIDSYDYNRPYGSGSNRFKISPTYIIKLGASAWGLDFTDYTDERGLSHSVVVTSDNTHRITLLYYHEPDHRFYHVTTHAILHNIPEVSVLSAEVDNDLHIIKVVGVSISGELLVFEFKFRISAGPINEDEFIYFHNEKLYFVDLRRASMNVELDDLSRSDPVNEIYHNMLARVHFHKPSVKSRTILDEGCWTCKIANAAYFKPVQSIRAMVGDSSINEENEVKHITNESIILDCLYDPLRTSHLGVGAKWQFFISPTVTFREAPLPNEDPELKSAKLTRLDDEYRRIRKGVFADVHHNKGYPKGQSLNGKYYYYGSEIQPNMVAVSTFEKLGLFQSETLFCNSATRKLFDLSIPYNNESKYTNRISITCLIPELLCLVAVSQQGFVALMRLCQHRGLYGMRQEQLFPNAISLALGSRGYRSIIGLCARNISIQKPRFLVFLTYSDGVVISYELTESDFFPRSHLDLTFM